MRSKGNVDVSKPQRPDRSYLKGLISEVINSRITIIILGLITLSLCVVVMIILKQPKLIAVIDKENGETYVTVSEKLTENVLQRQLMFYSKKFCEDYLNLDHVNVIESRKKTLNIMHPKMKEEIGGDKYYETKEVLKAIDEKYTCSFKWLIYPKITVKSHPNYSVFCQFHRIINKKGYKPLEEIFNLKLDWIRIVKNPNPFERPHDLLLVKIEEIQKDSEELKNQLNLSYK